MIVPKLFYFLFLFRRRKNTNKRDYYIDRCDLWGFTREINSGISHVRYQLFPVGTTFTKLYVWWLRPLLCYGEYTHDCKLKQYSAKCWHINNMTSYKDFHFEM